MKRDKIIYWTSTILVALAFGLSSLLYLMHDPGLMENFNNIGYPPYFVNILGVAKLIGSVAIVLPYRSQLKEWAYAGFTFVLVGATWSHLATQTQFFAPLIFLMALAVSYFFYKRLFTNIG